MTHAPPTWSSRPSRLLCRATHCSWAVVFSTGCQWGLRSTCALSAPNSTSQSCAADRWPALTHPTRCPLPPNFPKHRSSHILPLPQTIDMYSFSAEGNLLMLQVHAKVSMIWPWSSFADSSPAAHFSSLARLCEDGQGPSLCLCTYHSDSLECALPRRLGELLFFPQGPI